MGKSWYAYGGGGDPTDISNYYNMGGSRAVCLCGNEICVIYADGGPTHPTSPLSVNVKMYIKKALISGQIQPDYPLGAKKYVYLRLTQ